jgi:hypothetical protein
MPASRRAPCADIAAAADLVRAGALAAAADLDLPGIEGPNA